jgi:PEP-CTERM motif
MVQQEYHLRQNGNSVAVSRISRKILATLTAGLFSVALFGQTVQAVPINGTISFTGTVELDTSSASTATAVTAWHGLASGDLPQVENRDGDFTAFVNRGDGTTFHAPWSFNSLSTISGFWTVDGFTFDLLNSHITNQGGSPGSGFVTVVGTGTVSGHGFDPTAGTWSFTTQDPSASSQFSFSASTAVPEPGTLTLLAVGAGGLISSRKRRGNT